jgi:hypothetical protein
LNAQIGELKIILSASEIKGETQKTQNEDE